MVLSRSSDGRRSCNWRKIAVTLADLENGEQTAQACANALFATVDFENLYFDGIIPTMFETLQPPRPEPAKGWFSPTVVYGSWCFLGASGVFVSFWKHSASVRLGFVSYATVFALALYFLFAARTRLSTRRDVSTRSFVLFLLASVPQFVSMFKM
jgi:hypothetical protein